MLLREIIYHRRVASVGAIMVVYVCANELRSVTHKHAHNRTTESLATPVTWPTQRSVFIWQPGETN